MNEAILLMAAAILFFLLRWAFRALPQEEWQFLAAVPMCKNNEGVWDGMNLTFYGIFKACSYAASMALMIILMGAVQISSHATIMLSVMILLICVPASGWIARAVEGKAHTFSVAGASFAGFLIAPPAIWLTNFILSARWEVQFPLLPTLAALAIVLAFGEGLGRLACLSFGCCYGKPLNDCSPPIRKIFLSKYMRFAGSTKKIAYEGNLERVRVVPIQAITSSVLLTGSLGEIWLFLHGYFGMALISASILMMGWRVVSELFRADERGGYQNLSVYQLMSAFLIFYAGALWYWAPEFALGSIDLLNGIRAMWRPEIILFLQLLWIVIFLYVGRSMVTGSHLSFHVHKDRI